MIRESTQQKKWSAVLDRIEETLAQALHAAEERQRDFEDYWSETGKTAAGCSWTQGLEDFHQRMQELVAIAERAAQSVQDVDGALAEEENSLQQWMVDTEAAKMKLTDWLDAEAQESSAEQ